MVFVFNHNTLLLGLQLTKIQGRDYSVGLLFESTVRAQSPCGLRV